MALDDSGKGMALSGGCIAPDREGAGAMAVGEIDIDSFRSA